jgi:membrane-associated phospholipid phosphatase
MKEYMNASDTQHGRDKDESLEVLEIFDSTESTTRVARVISEVTNPLFVALPIFLVIALGTSSDVVHALICWVITILGITLVPFLFILQGVRHGKYTDRHVSKREQRTIPLLVGLSSVAVTFVLLLLLHASRPLLATIVSDLVVLAVTLVITRFWKISLHLVGFAGAITVLVLLFGPIWLVLSPLVVVVAWARWQVRAHNPPQAIAGTVLAVIVTWLLFWLFQIHLAI